MFKLVYIVCIVFLLSKLINDFFLGNSCFFVGCFKFNILCFFEKKCKNKNKKNNEIWILCSVVVYKRYIV